MNVFSSFIASVALTWAVSFTVFGSQSTGVSLEVLNCQIQVPNGYVLRWNDSGMMQGSYTGKEIQSNPVFQYFPSTSFESRGSVVPRVIEEKDFGDFRYFRVDLGPGPEWEVVAGESSFFATWALPNSPFIAQFEACAASR
jgi:hypothetical protein